MVTAHVPKSSANKAYRKNCFTIISNSLNTYILTERRNFKRFWKENYAISLNSCSLFNVEYRTEHDIDSAYGVRMH